jgi:hypothetical protein
VKLVDAGDNYPLLMAAAFGKDASCTVGVDGLAACEIEGRPLAEALSDPAVIATSGSWRCQATASTGACLSRDQPSSALAALSKTVGAALSQATP